MYTEENEFDYNDYTNNNNYSDYNDYVDYDNNSQSPKKDYKGLIIKAILVIICIIIIIFLVFKIKNLSSQKGNNNDANNSVLVFNNNIELLRSASETYFFTNNNLPKENGEVVTVNVNKLVSEGLVKNVLDYDGEKCGYNTSYVSLTKNSRDYLMKINLVCSSLENSVTYYYNLDGKCLTCNGEKYTPSEETVENNNNNSNVNNNQENSNNNQNNNTNNSTNNDQNNSNNTLVCNTWSDWTTEYKNDNKLEREERTLIIAYKDNNIYGEWSDFTTLEIIPTDTLEVETEQREVTKNETSEWSSWTTEKPEEILGREIETKSTKVKNGTTKKCETVPKYTKSLTYKDASALSCSQTGTNKWVCIYNKKCSTVSKYNYVTYYRYQDTLENKEMVTFYKSRTITKGEPTYTDYILESEIPDGYQKLDGSDLKQYRYKEKCGK